MDQRPSVVPEQNLRAARTGEPREDKGRPPDSLMPDSLMAILKRASGVDEKEQRAPKPAVLQQPSSPPPAPANPPANLPDRRGDDPVDAAGHALIALLQSAAENSNAEYDRATINASRLANELRAVEDRIRQYEAEAAHFRERAARAEEWLKRIAREIESHLIPSRRSGPSPG
jgi:hypothetical protein